MPVQERIIVFCRYPVPGKAKTRLVPVLGRFGSAQLHLELTGRAVAQARSASRERGAELEIRATGGGIFALRRWFGRGFRVVDQGAGDLGRRMEAAFSAAFDGFVKRVVLVGTDIPTLKSDHLVQALELLKSSDAVFGPSHDGGYWLVGLNRPSGIFRDIPWGTSTVLGKTLEQASRLGLRTGFLSPRRDVDTIDDLRREGLLERFLRPYVTVIIPTLNEAGKVSAAVASARHEEAEILVVDGGSHDGTGDRAVASGARVLISPRGRALQQNSGARVAKGHVLLFLHADSRLPGNYMDAVFRSFLEAGVAAGAFSFRTDGAGILMKCVELLTNIRSRLFQLPYGDQGLFMPREVFASAGGFPETPIAEDLFLVRRLSGRGRIRTVPETLTTSARRWRRLGVVRTTLINQIILGGCIVGVAPEKLAGIYRATKS